MSRSLNLLAQSLQASDEAALAAQLPEATLGVVASPVEGAERGARTEVRLDAEGRRLLLAFSGPDTFALWDRPEHLASVRGSDLPDIARGSGATHVLLDPAGPAPSLFALEDLQSLVDGLLTDESGASTIRGDLSIKLPEDSEETRLLRAAARDAAAGKGELLELFVVDRCVGPRRLKAVLAHGPELEVAAFAHRLGGDDRVSIVDVIPVDATHRDRLARQFAASRVPSAAD